MPFQKATLYGTMVLLLLMLSGSTLCDVYYITPNLNTTCPSKLCLTLSQFADIANSDVSLGLNKSLIFLQGDHYLESSLKIANITTFRMYTDSHHKDVNIRCNWSRNLFHFEIHNVTHVDIYNLQLVGCTNRFACINELLMFDSTFIFSQRSALVLSNVSDVNILRSVFNFGKGGRYLPGRQLAIGGAIVAKMSKIMINECSFTENTAVFGGAVYVEKESTLVITNTSFEGNSVKCSPDSECYGGVIFSWNSYVTIRWSFFHNNSANSNKDNGQRSSYTYHNNGIQERGSHGGVFALNQSSVFISHNLFSHNTANRNGGVFKTLRSNITSIDNTFHQNKAIDGAVLHTIRSIFIDRKSKFINNTAKSKGGVIKCFTGKSKFLKSLFIANSATEQGGVVHMRTGILLINKSKVSQNCADRGGVIFGQVDAKVCIYSSRFLENIANSGAAVVLLHEAKQLVITGSTFSGNTIITHSANGGAVMHIVSALTTYSTTCRVLCKNNSFSNNFVGLRGSGDGGVFYGDNVNVVICSSIFINNTAGRRGGVIFISGGSSITLNGSTFCNNSAIDGGVVCLESSHLSIVQCTFQGNRAAVGSVIFTSSKSTIAVQDVDIIENIAEDAATFYLMDCTGAFLGCANFTENVGSVLMYSSVINLTNHVKFINSSISNSNQTFYQEGGAITVFQSQLEIHGECILLRNSAEHGGGLHASESTINVHGNLTIEMNRAEISGGAIYLQQSELNFKSNSFVRLFANVARNKGGGVCAIGSSVKLYFHEIKDVIYIEYYYTGSVLEFLNNEGQKGGGLFLESNAKFYILKEETAILPLPPFIRNLPLVCDIQAITFAHNTADYGAAIYVDDGTYFATCDSILSSTSTECFLQVVHTNHPTRSKHCISSYISFKDNTANIQGVALYGGLLDRCKISPFANIYGDLSPEETNRVSFFTNFNDTELSSGPVRVCFCKDGLPDCSYEPSRKHVKKGESFYVSLVAVDDVNHTLSNVTIQTTLPSNSGGLGENQLRQVTNSKYLCTELEFKVYSPNDNEELILYADGPCKDALPSQRRVQIQFSPCSCPIGFQPVSSQLTRCECECDTKLDNYISDCYPKTGYLVRKGNSWITGYHYSSNDTTSYNYLTYANCPLDYCPLPDSVVMFNLNIQDGADAQCAYNHSGKLCGPCKSGLSLSLGSSRCVSCPSYWPGLLVTIIAAAILGGIFLTLTLLTLNLTVASGTLNGIIFYTNIVHANISIFLPFHKSNVLAVFIAWMNLDLGFDTCFFDGMDAYWKTLLQLVFPAYLITLVVLIIIISERYTWFARLFERKNPVATLATIILLSYVRLLHVIIITFSFIVLNYPDGSVEVVWLPDATVPFFKGKHIVLILIAFIVLLAGIVYTALLFSWQWLLRCKNNVIRIFVNNQKLYMFVETYHAPYSFNYRYWTGLLLVVRAVLYIVSAVNVTRNPEVNVLATSIAMSGLLLLKGYLKKTIYKKWPLDLIETFCYMNMLCFCLAKFFTLVKNRTYSGTLIAYVSTSFAVTLFAIVIAYHIYSEVFSNTIIRFIKKVRDRKLAANTGELETNAQYNLLTDFQNPTNQPTFSVVSLTEDSVSLTECHELDNHATHESA